MSQFGGANPAFFGAPVVPVDPVSAGARQSISNTSDNAVRQEQIQAQAAAEAARLRLQQEEMKNRARLEELGLKADKARLDLDREMGERQLKLQENRLEQQRIEAEESQRLAQQREERLSEQGDRQLDMQETELRMQEAELRFRFMEESAGSMADMEAQADREMAEFARDRQLTAAEYSARTEKIRTDLMERQSELAAEASAKAKLMQGTLSDLGGQFRALEQIRDALVAAEEEATDTIGEAVPEIVNDTLVSLQDRLSEVGVREFFSRAETNIARGVVGFMAGASQTPTGEDFVSAMELPLLRGANQEFVGIPNSSLMVPADLLPGDLGPEMVGILEAKGMRGMRERFSGAAEGLGSLGARGFDAMAGEGARMTEEDAMAVLDQMTGGNGQELLASDPDSVRHLLRSFVLAGRNLEDQSEVIEGGPGYVKTGIERLGRAYARGAQEMLDVLDLGLDESRAIDSFLSRYREKMVQAFSDPEQAPILVRRLRDEMEQMVEEGDAIRPEEAEIVGEMLTLAEQAISFAEEAENLEEERRDIGIQASRQIDDLRMEEVEETRAALDEVQSRIEQERTEALEQRRREFSDIFEIVGLND